MAARNHDKESLYRMSVGPTRTVFDEAVSLNIYLHIGSKNDVSM